MQEKRKAYEQAKRERETLFALIAEKERLVAELRDKKDAIMLRYQQAQADKGGMLRILRQGEQLKKEVELLKEKEEIEALMEKREQMVLEEDRLLWEAEAKLEEKKTLYAECRRKQDRLTTIFEQGRELEHQEHQLKQELKKAEQQVHKMQAAEKLKRNYDELMAELAQFSAASDKEPEEMAEKAAKIKKEAEAEKITLELLLEQMGIRLQPKAALPAMSQFEEQRDAIFKTLEKVLEQIEVLLKEQEEGIRAREQAGSLVSEIEKEREALALRTEKLQRLKTEQVKQRQKVQEILLETSSSTLKEAEAALQNFIAEQEKKKDEIVQAERDYDEWDYLYKSETAILDQLYEQRLIRLQKEQVALEEYNKGLRNS